MTASALLLAIPGLLFTFMPAEILFYFNQASAKPVELLIQISGALYVGFAMLNWMTRTSVIGGIYNKPMVVANFSHFFIAAMALIKIMMADAGLPAWLWAVTAIYTIFAMCFGVLFMKNPVAKKEII